MPDFEWTLIPVDQLATAEPLRRERPRTIITSDPCEGCDQAAHCRAHRHACRLFAYWLKFGRVREKLGRNPSRAIYRRCYY